MSNKDYCLQLAASKLPTKELPCPACSLGPCLFVQPRLKTRPGRKKKSSRTDRRKIFPSIRHTDHFYSQNSTFLPRYGDAYDLSEADWNLDDFVGVGDLVNEVTEIRELNRIPSSRGTQVLHNKFYVHPSLVTSPGPVLIFKSEAPAGAPYYSWCWFQECVAASFLTNEIAQLYINGDVGVGGMLHEEANVVDGFAFNAMRPAFKTGFSLLNFMLELGDLKSIVPSTLESLRAVENWYNQWMKFASGRGFVKPSLSRIVNSVADHHLGYQFGVLPTIGDVQTVCDVLERIRTNVQRFKDGAKALGNVRHFKASFQPSPEYLESTRRTITMTIGQFRFDYDCVLDGFEPVSNGTPADHVSYNATMEFTYACKTLGDMDPLVAALYTKLGIKPDASIIWNAIPFSFVIDWFVDIGAFLDKYASVDLITSEVTIHQWWRGLKSRPRWKCVPVNMTCGATGDEKPVIGSAPVITVYGQSYTRLIHDVDVEKLVEINSETPDGLTLHRGLLSASLLKKLVFH